MDHLPLTLLPPYQNSLNLPMRMAGRMSFRLLSLGPVQIVLMRIWYGDLMPSEHG